MSLIKFNTKVFNHSSLNHWLVKKTLSIGNKDTDDYTRAEYNKLMKEAGMIDINDEKKEVIKIKIKDFAENLTVLQFNSMI